MPIIRNSFIYMEAINKLLKKTNNIVWVYNQRYFYHYIHEFPAGVVYTRLVDEASQYFNIEEERINEPFHQQRS